MIEPGRLQLLERQHTLDSGIVVQRWFVREGKNITRTEVYFNTDGSVVAYHDSVNGDHRPLRMDMMFKALYEGETEFNSILQYSGVHDPSKIQTYSTGR